MRAPITSVVKQVASSSNACSQYLCRGARGAYNGIGRMYSTVDEAIGGVGSDMQFSASRFRRGLPLDATTRRSTQYRVPSTKQKPGAGAERELGGNQRSDKGWREYRAVLGTWYCLQSIDCNSFPGLKRTALPGGIDTSAPVRGLRPMPVLRGRTLNTPNPRSSMRLPWASAFFMLSKTVSTANSALVLVMPVLATTSLIISSLITNGSPMLSENHPSSD